MRIAIAAGGTGGHIFPALSIALSLKKEKPGISLLWFGTTRNREKELCEKHNIPIEFLSVSSSLIRFSLKIVGAFIQFIHEVFKVLNIFKEHKCDAVIAFGGYVSAPVLAAGMLKSVPFFLHEQNTVPGFVNRTFSRFAKCTFLGFPLVGNWKLPGILNVVGTPVRPLENGFENFDYPSGLDRAKKTVLICGGSQGAQSMNKTLINPVKNWLNNEIQVVWQTGKAGFQEITDAVGSHKSAFIFESIEDLYPYYAICRAVIGRSGASTLAEVAYFGLPCVMIPLPWSAENHQWMNAGLVEAQGWGIRISQDDNTGERVDKAVTEILSEDNRFEKMSRMALDNGLTNASQEIAREIFKWLT